MSLRVLVVPEDPTNNGYILKPLIQTLLTAAGRPRAFVTVLTNPRLTGFDHAMKALREELPEKYGHFDLWIFMPDADRAAPAAMVALEQDMSARGIRLMVCAAQPEVEIYCCAAHRAELGLSWNEARVHPRFKEEVFEPLLAKRGDRRRAGGGRDLLIAASLGNFQHLLQLCPELGELSRRINVAVNEIQEG